MGRLFFFTFKNCKISQYKKQPLTAYHIEKKNNKQAHKTPLIFFFLSQTFVKQLK